MLAHSPLIVTLPAWDLDRASHFYEDVLGLSRAEDMPGEDGGIVYESGGSRFYVYQTEAPRGGATSAFFLVDDLSAEMGELRHRDLEFEEYDLPGLKTVDGVFESGGMRSAWFKDSEGNILALTQQVPVPAAV
jgi:catechol 2,3-dioxygenase-like lactoylglutathione lyase family enzyme